jgi:hypothetical protein
MPKPPRPPQNFGLRGSASSASRRKTTATDRRALASTRVWALILALDEPERARAAGSRAVESAPEPISDDELMDYLLDRLKPMRRKGLEVAVRSDDRLLARLIEIRAGLEESSRGEDVDRLTEAAQSVRRRRLGTVAIRANANGMMFSFEPSQRGKASPATRPLRQELGDLFAERRPQDEFARGLRREPNDALKLRRIAKTADERVSGAYQSIASMLADLATSARLALARFQQGIEASTKTSETSAPIEDLAILAAALRDQLSGARAIQTLGREIERALVEELDWIEFALSLREQGRQSGVSRRVSDASLMDRLVEDTSPWERSLAYLRLPDVEPTTPLLSGHVTVDAGPWRLRFEAAVTFLPSVRLIVTGNDLVADPPLLTVVAPGRDLSVLSRDSDGSACFPLPTSDAVLLIQSGDVWELKLRNEGIAADG